MSSSEFAKQYEELTDEQFGTINAADLIPEARAAYEAEVTRRSAPEYIQGQRQVLDKWESERAPKSTKRTTLLIRWGVTIAVVITGFSIWFYADSHPSIEKLSLAQGAKWCDKFVVVTGTVDCTRSDMTGSDICSLNDRFAISVKFSEKLPLPRNGARVQVGGLTSCDIWPSHTFVTLHEITRKTR